jgi:acetyl-CoA carboxylase biotin carboxyl carrier protein
VERKTGEVELFDVEMVSRLVELMVEKDLREIELQEGESKILLKRGAGGEVVQQVLAPAAAAPIAAAPEAASASSPADDGADDGLVPISSPMVGTYYASSEPGAPPFVSAGSMVSSDTVVCIIEAMKVFNEIKSEISGTVERILVQNEQPVEFGQPLYLVRPS